MAEADRADLERRLRIRRRNLERLRQEEKYIADSETPPAVLDRIQAQIRVESEEVRLLEGQLYELEGRGRHRPGSRGFSLPARVLRGFSLFAGILRGFPLSAGGSRGFPLSAGGSRGFPLSAGGLRGFPLSAGGLRGFPLSAGGLRGFPLSAGGLRGVLAIVAIGLLLAMIVLVVPRSLGGVAFLNPAPTDTPVPTPTLMAVPPTETSVPTSTPVPTATYTLTPEAPVPTSTPTLAPTSALPRGKVNVEVLNLRGGPSTEFGIRSKLTLGEEFDVLGRNEIGTWLAVSTQDGATGWIAAEYVDLTLMILDLPISAVEE